MFSLQQLFGKGDRFYGLLEDAAQEAHQSVRLVLELIRSSGGARNREELVLARRKEKRISERISEELVKTFVTGLDREDIEALALALYKIPKSAEKLAERYQLGTQHLQGVDLTPLAEKMEKATDVVFAMVKHLRRIDDLEELKELSDKLQLVEGEADRLMIEFLKELYSGRYEALRAMVIRDVFELMEKVIDRCRDAGNVVTHIVLKNS
jgi:uncharacterized protein